MPAQDLAARIQTLQNVHPWMDALTSSTIAQQQINTQQMLGVAEQLRQQTANTYTGYTPYSYDPAQHQPQTTRAFAQGYVNTVRGGNPFDTSSLTEMQKGLQRLGYGTNLQITGAWSSDWQQALGEHTQAVYEDHLAGGNKPLSTTSHGLLHSALHAISPSGIASAVVGTIKSLPADFRNLTSDVLGGAVTIGGTLTEGLAQGVTGNGLEGVRAALRQGAAVGAGINNALGGEHLSSQEYYNQRQDLGRLVNDIGTLAMIVPGIGEAVGGGLKGLMALGRGTDLAAAQAGQGVLRSSLGRTVGHEAAQRTPGMMAAAAGSRAGKRVITGAALGATTGGINAAANGGDVSTGITEGALLGGALGGATRFAERVGSATNALPKNALDNLPVLKQTGSIVDRLADSDGLYYAMRNRLAKPYEYGAVRLAGDALTQGQAFSLKMNGLSWLENTVGDDPNTQPLARYIAGSHPLDPIDHAMAVAAEKAHLPFTPKTDWLMFVLHGDLRGIGHEPGDSGGLTGDIARKSQAVHDSINAALGQTGYAERIIRATGRNYDQLLQDAHGDETLLQDWMWNKVHQAAASVYSEDVLAKYLRADPAGGKALLADHDRFVTFMRTARDEAISNPETMKEAHDLLALPKNSNYLETHIYKELIHTKTKPGESLRHEIGDYVKTGNVLRDEILPRIERDFLTPQEATVAPKGALPEMRKTLLKAGFGWTGFYAGKGSVADGSIGLMRHGKLTSQQAEKDLQGFTERAQPLLADWKVANSRTVKAEDAERRANIDLPRLNGKLDDLYTEMLDYAYNEHGITRRPLAVYKGRDPEQGISKLLSLLGDARKHLASEVYLAEDASPEARAAYQKVHDAGYMLVHGKDIGHLYLNRIQRPGSLGLLQKRQRQVAAALGLNTERFNRTDVATRARYRMVSRLERAHAQGKLSFGQHGSAQDALNDLTDPELLAGADNSWAQKIAFGLAAPFHQRNIDALKEHYGETPQAAEARLKQDLALAGGVRALPRKTAVKILTRHDADGVPIMDERSANRIYEEIMAAQAETATYQVGLTKLEDLMRFGAFKFAADHDWNLDRWRAVMALPNNLIRARDQWRFAMNPMFSVRRIVKTNVKMNMDGVHGSHNPVRWMTERDAFDDAHNLLDRIEGNQSGFYEYKDEAERYLDQHDVWGMYDPRAYKAMYVYQKQQQGFSDEEIRQGLNRVFDYGGRGEQGRTALERTTNVIFFPFSFEKTLLRSVGGYLADHQAQALVLDQALDAYRQFSAAHPDSPLTKQWIEKHAPVLEEALKLNAFAHGISPGELGGINRPILNAFMPQSWATGKDSYHTLTRFIPAVNDLHRIKGEIGQQYAVVRTSLANATARLEGNGGNSLFRLPSNATAKAQIGDAIAFRLQLLDAFGQVISFNDSQDSDEAKYHFGYADNIPAEVRGQVINRSTLAQIVHLAYPAWSPYDAARRAEKAQQQTKMWLASQHEQPDFARYNDYVDKAKTAIAHMNGDEYPVEQLAQVQALFRSEAKDLIKGNKDFRDLYQRAFARYFGPLEAKA